MATRSGTPARTMFRMAQAADILDMPLLDHLIVGDAGRYFSFRETGSLAAHIADEVIKDLPVDLLDCTFRRQDDDQAGDRIDEQSKARFAHAEGVFDARMLLVLAFGVIG